VAPFELITPVAEAGELDRRLVRLPHRRDRDVGSLGHTARQLDEPVDQEPAAPVDHGELVGGAPDVDADDVAVRLHGPAA
jgi:hypothetical protein